MLLTDSVTFVELREAIIDAAKDSISTLAFELSKDTINLSVAQLKSTANDINAYIRDIQKLLELPDNTDLLTVDLDGLYKLDILALDGEE